ncbi:MAG: flagellar export protein FliJ [Buchnera aphidicola (Eriosoma harunire)]
MVDINHIMILETKVKMKLQLVILDLQKQMVKKSHMFRQLSQLIKFYEEYNILFSQSLKNGITVNRMICYVNFIKVLKKHIVLQNEELLKCKDHINSVKNRVKDFQNQENIYQKLKKIILRNNIIKKESVNQNNNDLLSALCWLNKG